MANRIKLTPKKKEQFLDALRRGVSGATAARACHVNPRTVWEHRRKDPAFAEQWEAAWQEGADVFEDVLLQNATRNKDTAAAIFVLKSRRPAVYNPPTRIGVGGMPGAPPIEHAMRARLVILPDNHRAIMTEEEIRAEREAVAKESMIG